MNKKKRNNLTNIEGIVENCWYGPENVGFRVEGNPNYIHFPARSIHLPPVQAGQYVKVAAQKSSTKMSNYLQVFKMVAYAGQPKGTNLLYNYSSSSEIKKT